MLELRDYPKPLVPRDVGAQIRSYVRMQWPHLDARDGTLWNVPADSPTRTFVVLDGEQLVSHAEANFRTVDHAGTTFHVGGLSAVFTYPAYRRGGCAAQVVHAATAFLDAGNADLAMLFCGDPLRPFYGSVGWEPIDTARILCGDRATPTLHADTRVMMRFTSEKGRAARERFESQAVYVGERTW